MNSTSVAFVAFVVLVGCAEEEAPVATCAEIADFDGPENRDFLARRLSYCAEIQSSCESASRLLVGCKGESLCGVDCLCWSEVLPGFSWGRCVDDACDCSQP